MPTLYNPGKKKGIFFIPSGATVSPITPVPAFSSTKSLEFDGVDDYVDTGAKLSVDGLSTASFSLWFLTDSTGYKYIFGDNKNRLLYHQPSGRIDLTFDGSAAYRTFSASTVFGDWNNIVITFDGSLAQADRLKVYLNGGTPIANTLGGTTSTTLTSVVNFYLGRAGVYASGLWTGNLDEFSIWNTALIQSEVTEIYNIGTPNDLATHSGTAGLVNWYRMGENSTFSSQILMPENTNKDKVSNYSMEFDGIGDRVDVAYNASLDVASANHSISFWLKTTSSAVTVLSEKSSTELAVWLLSSKIYWAGANAFSSATTINDGTWKHICLVADGAVSYIYINGSLSATGGNKIVGTTNTNSFVYGARANSSFVLNGNIDELAIFNTALTQLEVTAIYGIGTPTDLTSLSPVSWWRMGEKATFSTVWTIPDQIGSNTGTSANMTIEDRTGDAPDSSNNALSYNMDAADIVEDVPPNP